MPIFIDESGGWAANYPHPYFILSAVWFEQHTEVDHCEAAICSARTELTVGPSFEFHFAKINQHQRNVFFRRVSSCNFVFTSCVIEKANIDGLWREKAHLFQNSIASLVTSLEEYLHIAEAIKGTSLNERVTADNNGDADYFRILSEEFKRPKSRLNEKKSMVEKVRWGRAHTSSMLQLSDMICGAVGHSIDKTQLYIDHVKAEGEAIHFPLRKN